MRGQCGLASALVQLGEPADADPLYWKARQEPLALVEATLGLAECALQRGDPMGALELLAARRAGELLARTGGADVVDALVPGFAREGDTVLTSDPDDLITLLDASSTRASVFWA